MAPLVSTKEFEDKQLQPGSALEILCQVACVAKKNLKRRREERSTKIKTQMGSSSTPKIEESHYVADGYSFGSKERYASMNKIVRRDDDVDDYDKSFQLKRQNTMLLHKEIGSTSKTKELSPSVGKALEVNRVYSVGTMRRERSSSRENYITSSDLGFQEKNWMTKKKSIDGDKDWDLKPKPRNIKIQKVKGLGFKRHIRLIRAPTHNTDPSNLPEELKKKIETLEGIESFEKAEMTLVIEKNLFCTDMAKSANRLSMPLKQIKPESFLDEDEIKLLANQEDWPVSVISPQLGEEALTFRQWNMKKENGSISSSYVLKKRWNEVRKNNDLKRNDLIQVWSFRDVGNNLHFALVLVEKSKDGGSSTSDGDGCSLPSSRSTTPLAPSKSDAVDGESNTSDIGQGTETNEQAMIRGVDTNDWSSSGNGRGSTPSGNGRGSTPSGNESHHSHDQEIEM